jgi:Phosphotransferase enzyme family
VRVPLPALAWFDEQLVAAGVARVGEIVLERERPWASVFRAETTAGRLWLKACGTGTRFEVGLYQLLDRIAPNRVLTPMALDVERAWIVLPDGGQLLADDTDEDRLPGQLEVVFAQYAELQIAAADHVDNLLAIGIADMRPAAMTGRFEEALEFVAPYLEQRGTTDERAAYERLLLLRPTVATWCERLAGSPGAASLDHNDLHPWNVFFTDGPGPGGGQSRFYDWGDAVVAHPFASMLVGLGSLKRIHGFADNDPRMLRIRDAYLEPFGELALRAELVATLELACRVGQIARALVWARAVGEMGAAAPDTYQTAPMQHLANLLDDSYLGRH